MKLLPQLLKSALVRKLAMPLPFFTARKALLYDLDGTIIDTDALHLAAWQRTGLEFGFEITAEQLATVKGLSSKKTLEALLPKEQHLIINEASERKFQYLMELTGNVEILGNFTEAYEQLARRNIPFGVCTSARRDFVDAIIKNVPALKTVLEGKTVCKEMFKEGKPSAEPLRVTLDFMGEVSGRRIPASSALYVGDGYSDYGAAQNAGMPFLYFCPREEKREVRIPPEIITIKDHRELLAYI